MKIAVTHENGQVFGHFGKTESFAVFETGDGKVLSKQIIPTNGTGHGALAGFLKDLGAQVVICGGIGDGAKRALEAAGVILVAGASGDVEQAALAYLSGELKNDPAGTCGHHHGEEGRACGAPRACGHR